MHKLSNQRQRRRARRAGGFTLIELLVAMLILAIGIMAILQMQFSSLGGAMVARDTANASDTAHRVFQVMQAESQRWRQGDMASELSGNPAVDNDAFAPSGTLLKAVKDAGDWTWTSLVTNPVDTRLTTKGNARFCIFARGAYMVTNDVYVVHLAVVFPKTNQQFDDNLCSSVDTNKLDPTINPEDDADALQRKGFYVQYFGTQITRKGFLDGGA